MTWFRVGGAGIPATLKNAMNAVFNKKFGTSGQNYPPKQWPDDVNLLGKLPEKTVSGSIAHITDGADTVPIKSWEVEIAPTLTGKSAVVCTACGNNLFDKSKATIGKYINVNGQEATNEIKAHSVLLPLKPSTSYYMSGYAYGSYYSILALDKDMNVLSTWYGGASKTEPFVATTPNNARWCYLNFNADQIDTVIFAESATAISYEPYNGTTSTVNLGRTIYGGTADVVNGTCEPINWLDGINGYTVLANATAQTLIGSCDLEANVDYTLSCSMTGTPTQRTRNRWAVAKSSNMWDGTAVFGNDFYVAPQQTFTPSESGTYYFFIWSQGIDVDVSYDDFQCEIGSTASDYSPYFEPFTFTPITPTPETALGVNNFWADEGDTTVVYRRDIDLALQAVSSSRGLMMASRPVTQLVGKESDPDQVNELVDNNEIEQEGESDAR